MSTTYTAKSFAAPAVALTAHPGPIVRVSKSESFTLSTSGDVIKFFQLPVNAKIIGGGFSCGELDTNGTDTLTLEYSVTDGTTTKKLIDGATANASAQSYDARVMGQAGLAGSVAGEKDYLSGWFGFVTNNDSYYVRLKATANSATAAAASVVAFIEYTMVLEGGEVT